ERGYALSRKTHAHSLEVLEAFELAAVDQILAHEHGLVEIARLGVPAVGNDAKFDAADERIPKPDRQCAAADVELARAERRDDLRAGIEHDQVDVQALIFEETLVVGDIERRVAGRSAGSDRNLVGC